MAWQLQGTYFENCSCDMVCPCTTSGLTMPADYDRCRVVLAFHINTGTVDDVDVSNLTVGVLADTPPLMADGNWRVGVVMDAAASQEQAEKLWARGELLARMVGVAALALAVAVIWVPALAPRPPRHRPDDGHGRILTQNATSHRLVRRRRLADSAWMAWFA
jgi:Protein of unknown function (DUF1326)